MGLAVGELDTLDATEHMALSRRRGTLCGSKCTCLRNDDAYHNMQHSPGLRYTICPKEKATPSEATMLDPTTDPGWAVGVEAS